MKPTIFQLRLPPDLHRQLKRAAFENNVSMNKAIIEAIETMLIGEQLESQKKGKD